MSKDLTPEFRLLETTRQNIIKVVNSVDLHRLNLIPAHANNNLIWNFAHVLVTQQLLCYKMSGLSVNLEQELIESFRKGTKPEKDYSDTFVRELVARSAKLTEQLQEDYRSGIFTNFTPYETSYGFTLNNIEEAITFNNAHEALHLGYMMALAKFI